MSDLPEHIRAFTDSSVNEDIKSVQKAKSQPKPRQPPSQRTAPPQQKPVQHDDSAEDTKEKLDMLRKVELYRSLRCFDEFTKDTRQVTLTCNSSFHDIAFVYDSIKRNIGSADAYKNGLQSICTITSYIEQYYPVLFGKLQTKGLTNVCAESFQKPEGQRLIWEWQIEYGIFSIGAHLFARTFVFIGSIITQVHVANQNPHVFQAMHMESMNAEAFTVKPNEKVAKKSK